MRKYYHYIFKLDDREKPHPEFLDLESLISFHGYDDVKSYLNRQRFDISSSVVRNLVEYAGKQLSGSHGKSH